MMTVSWCETIISRRNTRHYSYNNMTMRQHLACCDRSYAEPHVLNVNVKQSDEMRSTSWWVSLRRLSSRRQALVNPASLRRVLELCKFTLALCVPCKDDAVVKPVGLTLPELDHIRFDNVAPPFGERRGEYQNNWLNWERYTKKLGHNNTFNTSFIYQSDIIQ